MNQTRKNALIVGLVALAVLAACALSAAVLFGPQPLETERSIQAGVFASASLATPSVLIPLGGLLGFTALTCGIGFYLGNRHRALERVDEAALDE